MERMRRIQREEAVAAYPWFLLLRLQRFSPFPQSLTPLSSSLTLAASPRPTPEDGDADADADATSSGDVHEHHWRVRVTRTSQAGGVHFHCLLAIGLFLRSESVTVLSPVDCHVCSAIDLILFHEDVPTVSGVLLLCVRVNRVEDPGALSWLQLEQAWLVSDLWCDGMVWSEVLLKVADHSIRALSLLSFKRLGYVMTFAWYQNLEFFSLLASPSSRFLWDTKKITDNQQDREKCLNILPYGGLCEE